MSTQRIISEKELAANEWVRVGNKILNIADFKHMHPGGEKVLSRYAGRDATDVFFGIITTFFFLPSIHHPTPSPPSSFFKDPPVRPHARMTA